jgi:hypothetical protein
VDVSAQTLFQGVCVVLIVLSTVTIGAAYVTAMGDQPSSAPPAEVAAQRYQAGNRQPVVAPRDGITVIATDSNTWLGRLSKDPRSNAELLAFAPNGSTLYYNSTHTRYWDVDPVNKTGTTVEYLYADHLNASECPNFRSKNYWRTHEYANSVPWNRWKEYAKPHKDTACTRNGIVRVNLRTGESTEIYSAITPGKHSTRWHDGDRINDTHYVVADIYLDRVFIVNTKTGEITWQWNARSAYPPKNSGGSYPPDWTHINDIQVLPDGRLMADLRNHDQVVFLNTTQPPQQAVIEDWTLGQQNNHSILYEQHNPDYIPRSDGGPAVLVADSENNRIVEYQRVNGSWERTWTWTDSRMQWPRDADRLPNGHTLITDSNGDRVFEIDEHGKIVWSSDTAFPYEAERLPGDESDGPSIRSLQHSASNDVGPLEQVWLSVKGVFSGPVFSAINYVLPYWMRTVELAALVVLVGSVLCLTLARLWWALRPRLSNVHIRNS